MTNLDIEFERAREMISNSKNPIMFFDTDTDGSTAFIQLSSSFSQIKEGYGISKDDDIQLLAMERVTSEHDLVIFFDTPVIISEFLERISDKQVIVCDHHLVKNDLLTKMDNVFYLNPLNYDVNDNRCCSYLAYKVCNDTSNLKWVCMGVVADFYILDVLKEFYESDETGFNLLFPMSDEKRIELFTFIDSYDFRDESKSNEKAYWVQFLTYECNFIFFKMFFDVLFKFEKFDETLKILKNISRMNLVDFKSELLNGKIGIFEKYSEIVSEFNSVFKRVDKVETTPLIYVFHHDMTISFNRQVAEKLAHERDDFKVIFSAYTKEEMKFYSCSFRGKNFDVNELVTSCLKGLSGQGGGHKFAAGAIVSKHDFDLFKKRVYEFFESKN